MPRPGVADGGRCVGAPLNLGVNSEVTSGRQSGGDQVIRALRGSDLTRRDRADGAYSTRRMRPLAKYYGV